MKFKLEPDLFKTDDMTAAYAVMEAAYIGFKQVEYSYGREYIKVIDQTFID